jgi:hypothetical protein
MSALIPISAALFAAPSPALAAAVMLPPQPRVEDPMAAARALTQRRTRSDCIAERLTTRDIIVCAPADDQQLPVPEIYGPVPGSTDGAAVDPRGPPCGASISNQCYGGVDIIGTMAGAAKLIGLLIDPDRNLGEGDPIPERFRGANR